MHSPVNPGQAASSFLGGPLHCADGRPAPLLPSTPTTGGIISMKPSRRVQFFQARIVCTVTPNSSLTEEERNERWYQPQELDDFRNEARSLCREIRDQQTGGSNAAEMGDFPNRGLEHRVCIKRQRNKAIAVRCIIKAQDRNRDPSFIAMIAEKCTLWAKEVAAVEASRDYCIVYCPHLLSCVPTIESIEQHPFPVKKRSATDTELDSQDEYNGRNLRGRVSTD